MIPYFAAETGAFDVGVGVNQTAPTVATLASFTLSIPADRYAIGDACDGSGGGDTRSVYRLLCDEVTSETSGVTLSMIANTGSVTDTDTDLCGLAWKFSVSGLTSGQAIKVIFTGANADRARAAFGFTASGGIAATQLVNTAGLQRQPSNTWFPKSHLAGVDDWVPHARDIFHSDVTGDGSSTGVIQDDGVRRYWRKWMVSAVPGARMVQRRASNSVRDWYETAGLSSVSGAEYVALDYYTSATDHGWWHATANGVTRFICVEDETATTPEFSRYRFNFSDPRAPVSMQGWLGLQSPNVSSYSDAAGRRDVSFCAFEDPIT